MGKYIDLDKYSAELYEDDCISDSAYPKDAISDYSEDDHVSIGRYSYGFYNSINQYYAPNVSKMSFYRDAIDCHLHYKGLSDMMNDCIIYHRYKDDKGNAITKRIPNHSFDYLVRVWYNKWGNIKL